MSPLLQIIRSGHCHSTHQMLAVDALRLVQTPSGKRLTGLLVRYYRHYLRGAIDPDTRFCDYQNHVIHVRDGYWGGAPRVAHQWYDRLQRYLRTRRYAYAAHAAGVLSHYFTDPIHPLNTAYSPEEDLLHAPIQWSIQRGYREIFQKWQRDEFRIVFQLADGPGWLGAAMLHGARFSHARFQSLFDSYDLQAALKDPARGLNQTLRSTMAELCGLAITGWARVLERAASDAEAVARKPLPKSSVALPLMTTLATAPVAYWRYQAQQRREDAHIKDLLQEYQQTGRVIEHLPASVDIKRRVINVYRRERHYRLHRQQRLAAIGDNQRNDLQPTIIAIRPETQAPARPIESIVSDPEDRKQLRAAGIHSLNELMSGTTDEVAATVNAYWITSDTIDTWRYEATLLQQVPGMTATAARMFVGAGYQSAEKVAAENVDDIYRSIVAFAATTRGRRCLQRPVVPTRPQVSLWVRQIKSRAMLDADARVA